MINDRAVWDATCSDSAAFLGAYPSGKHLVMHSEHENNSPFPSARPNTPRKAVAAASTGRACAMIDRTVNLNSRSSGRCAAY